VPAALALVSLQFFWDKKSAATTIMVLLGPNTDGWHQVRVGIKSDGSGVRSRKKEWERGMQGEERGERKERWGDREGVRCDVQVSCRWPAEP